MKCLAVITGEYGKRHVANIRKHGPRDWIIESWQAPRFFPPVIDYPEDFLPDQMPAADLVLSFAEHKGAAELLPTIARLTDTEAVLVAVDDERWLPPGLDRQLRGWLQEMDVACVTPKPLCSLTETEYGVTRHQSRPYDNHWIRAFARHFGKPEIKLDIDQESKTIRGAEVIRDAVCGCARHVAQELVGCPVDQAEEKAGLAHHHYPCLASMAKLPDFNHDTLMHTSGQILKNSVAEQVKPYKTIRYFKPGKYAD